MTKEEKDMINAINLKRSADKEMTLFQELLPAIRAAIKAGGGADAIMKKSGPLAAYKTVQLLSSEREEVALKAADKILSYDLGKPVERSINVYGDISRLNERDMDNQILNLLKEIGPRRLIETTLDVPTKKKRQKRKPRTEKVLEAELVSETTTTREPT